jgi:hypothetical protein
VRVSLWVVKDCWDWDWGWDGVAHMALLVGGGGMLIVDD